MLWKSFNSTLTRILSALILYHHFTTIPQEINTLWTRKRSLASLIFFVNRYALLLVGAEYMAQIFPVYGDVLVDRVSMHVSPSLNTVLMLILVSEVSEILFVHDIVYANTLDHV